MADRIITRELLNDWILNDGLEHLFMEGYLHPSQVDPEDDELMTSVQEGFTNWQRYESSARNIQRVVDEYLEAQDA